MLSACLDDDSDDDHVPIEVPEMPAPVPSDIRILHASPDAPMVNVNADGNPIEVAQNLDYQGATSVFSVDPGTYQITVDALLPSDTTSTVIDAQATLEEATDYTILAVDNVAGLEPLIIANQDADIGAGNLRVQVVHAAPNAPTVDIYVTAPGADLTAEQPLDTLAFKEYTEQVEVPEGDYQIRITAAGETTAVFDSGTVSLAAGADLIVAATKNVDAGMSPVSLLVATTEGGSLLLDANTPAEVRAIHGIADAPAVDVLVDVANGDDILLFDGAPFKGVTTYIEVEEGEYLLDVVADADNSIVAINDVTAAVSAGVRYTAIANNTLTNADLDFAVDDARPLATAAQVRIFHASQATGGVDIYVTADGEIDSVEPTFTNVEYSTDMLTNTGYVQLAPGDYVVTVTPTGTKTEAIETGVLMLEAAKIYTALAVDGDMPGDGPQLILADDFIE